MSVSKVTNFCLPPQTLYSTLQTIEFGEVNKYCSSASHAKNVFVKPCNVTIFEPYCEYYIFQFAMDKNSSVFKSDQYCDDI